MIEQCSVVYSSIFEANDQITLKHIDGWYVHAMVSRNDDILVVYRKE